MGEVYLSALVDQRRTKGHYPWSVEVLVLWTPQPWAWALAKLDHLLLLMVSPGLATPDALPGGAGCTSEFVPQQL